MLAPIALAGVVCNLLICLAIWVAMPAYIKMHGGGLVWRWIALWWLADAIAYLLLFFRFKLGFFWLVLSLLVTVALSAYAGVLLPTTVCSGIAISLLLYTFHQHRDTWMSMH
ncbi:hypothetical protein [Chitinimonas sp. JJ19]|uniref:hypothetical protein n=1 Tax=Chitinimonas sp. JJ19 TaxID=3109352 RepID=UPI00300136C9